jgi:zinc transport system substrate-binding protein
VATRPRLLALRLRALRLRALRLGALMLGALMLGGLVLAGCGQSDRTEANDSNSERGRRRAMLVVAAIAPIAELARAVVSSETSVVTLAGAAVEPHDLELTSKQISDVEDADLVIYVRGLIPQLDKAVDNRQGPSLDLLTTVPTRNVGGGIDPHVWLDPTRMRTMSDALAIKLGARIDATNHIRYIAELTSLDEEFIRGLKACQRREFITAHESFGYLADRYNLKQIAVSGVSPEAEPDPNRFAELADLIRATGATTVFAEQKTSSDVANALAAEANVNVAVLSSLETISKGSTYLSTMRANLVALRTGLDCT